MKLDVGIYTEKQHLHTSSHRGFIDPSFLNGTNFRRVYTFRSLFVIPTFFLPIPRLNGGEQREASLVSSIHLSVRLTVLSNRPWALRPRRLSQTLCSYPQKTCRRECSRSAASISTATMIGMYLWPRWWTPWPEWGSREVRWAMRHALLTTWCDFTPPLFLQVPLYLIVFYG